MKVSGAWATQMVMLTHLLSGDRFPRSLLVTMEEPGRSKG